LKRAEEQTYTYIHMYECMYKLNLKNMYENWDAQSGIDQK